MSRGRLATVLFAKRPVGPRCCVSLWGAMHSVDVAGVYNHTYCMHCILYGQVGHHARGHGREGVRGLWEVLYSHRIH